MFAYGDVADVFDRLDASDWLRGRISAAKGYIATGCAGCARPPLRFDEQLDDLFAHRFDYIDWIQLKLEDRSTIGLLEAEWNDFDRLTPQTKLLHTTKRRTQPWKTGLPVDYTLREKGWLTPALRFLSRRYQRHPDPRQEVFVYSLFRRVDCGESRQRAGSRTGANHIRLTRLSDRALSRNEVRGKMPQLGILFDRLDQLPPITLYRMGNATSYRLVDAKACPGSNASCPSSRPLPTRPK